MVTEDDKIKLIDFGFAMEETDQKSQKYFVGTPRFMSPEAIKKKYVSAGDIWSLGVSLYFILTAKFPFNANNMNDLKKQIS